MRSNIPTFFAIIIVSVISISAAGDQRGIPIAPVPENQKSLAFDEFDDLIKAALDLYGQKKYDEAIAASVKAADLRPSDFRPYYFAGISYMAQWKMKSASDNFAKGISLKSDVKQLHYLKAKADRYRNAKEESVASARKAIALDPSYAEAYAILGESISIGSDVNDDKQAIEAYRTAIKLKPDMLAVYSQLGMLLKVVKDEKAAEEIYRKAMELDPKKMACRFDLGRLLVDQGRLAEARKIWDGRAWDKDTTYPNFIDLLERAEKLKQATEKLAQKPNDPDALLQMGIMVMDGESWVVDGRQEKALVYLRKALELRPDFVKAQYAICKAYIEWADTYKDKNKNLDEEILKLRKLDAKMADEIVEYRKTYSGGLKASSGTIDQ